MLITKTNPTGIDLKIQQFQTDLHDRLMELWGLDKNDAGENKLFECYGRSYRNRKDTGYVAEIFNGTEYKDVYWNDSLNAISFFGISDKTDIIANNQTDVHLVVFVDLKKLALKDSSNTLITHRADNEVRNQVQNIIGRSMYGFSLNSIETGIANVLKEYPGSYRDTRLKNVDMHPVHCFRLNFSIEFDINNNCTP